MQKYFVKNEQIDVTLNKAFIIGSDVHHIKNVMRMKESSKIIISNNIDSYFCEIESIEDSIVKCNIIEKQTNNNELSINISIAHGLTTREKREEVIDKITQLGALKYIPIQLKKCLVKLSENSGKQIERLNKIAKEASEQSMRTKMLEVMEPIKLKELITMGKSYDLCLVASTVASSDVDNLTKYIVSKKYKNILILIGSEAGIDKTEEDELIKNGWIPFSLGKRILRTEVAPVYIMSVISYLDEFRKE